MHPDDGASSSPAIVRRETAAHALQNERAFLRVGGLPVVELAGATCPPRGVAWVRYDGRCSTSSPVGRGLPRSA